MAIITIDTDKLDAKLDYYTGGWYGVSIIHDGKVIKKLNK